MRVCIRSALPPVCAIGLVWLSACFPADQGGKAPTARETAANEQPQAAPPAEREEHPLLFGGDPQSWPTPAGNAGDSNYCDAALKLPLAREPEWEFTYTPVQFSQGDPTQFAHYDGLLAVIAGSPQILALDVDTGREIFNRDVYEHLNTNNPESITGLYFNPAGLLVGQDRAGRHYCWDVLGGEPRRLWLGKRTSGIGGYVALPDEVVTSYEGEVLGLDVSSGAEEWSYPKMGRRCGLVVSEDGVVVAWSSVNSTSSGEFYALNSASGTLKWSFLSGAIGWGGGIWAVIDDRQHCVYLGLADESVQRRDLDSGELAWEYSWRDRTTEEQRAALFAGSPFSGFPMYGVAPAVTPAGLVFCTIDGSVMALDQDGGLRWRYESGVAVWGSIAFSNAILAVEVFVPPANRQDFSPLQVFCPDSVDWDSYQQASEDERSTRVFERYCILDSATGEVLEYFETASPTAAAAPAHNMFVIGESATGMIRKHRIVAYDWLDWQPAADKTMNSGEDE